MESLVLNKVQDSKEAWGGAVVQLEENYCGVRAKKGCPVGTPVIMGEETEEIEGRLTRSPEGPDMRAPQ